MKYLVTSYWSEQDGRFLAEVPDLPGCIADGVTEEEARRHAEESADRWVSMAEYMGREVPVPSSSEPPALVSA